MFIPEAPPKLDINAEILSLSEKNKEKESLISSLEQRLTESSDIHRSNMLLKQKIISEQNFAHLQRKYRSLKDKMKLTQQQKDHERATITMNLSNDNNFIRISKDLKSAKPEIPRIKCPTPTNDTPNILSPREELPRIPKVSPRHSEIPHVLSPRGDNPHRVSPRDKSPRDKSTRILISPRSPRDRDTTHKFSPRDNLSLSAKLPSIQSFTPPPLQYSLKDDVSLYPLDTESENLSHSLNSREENWDQMDLMLGVGQFY